MPRYTNVVYVEIYSVLAYIKSLISVLYYFTVTFAVYFLSTKLRNTFLACSETETILQGFYYCYL